MSAAFTRAAMHYSGVVTAMLAAQADDSNPDPSWFVVMDINGEHEIDSCTRTARNVFTILTTEALAEDAVVLIANEAAFNAWANVTLNGEVAIIPAIERPNLFVTSMALVSPDEVDVGFNDDHGILNPIDGSLTVALETSLLNSAAVVLVNGSTLGYTGLTGAAADMFAFFEPAEFVQMFALSVPDEIGEQLTDA